MAEQVPAAILAVAMGMVDQLNQRAVEGKVDASSTYLYGH